MGGTNSKHKKTSIFWGCKGNNEYEKSTLIRHMWGTHHFYVSYLNFLTEFGREIGERTALSQSQRREKNLISPFLIDLAR